MKLEEGMYVRYIPTIGEYTQKISKITKTKNCLLDMCYTLDDKEEVFSSHFDDILGASHNIIDLIEVGDYVNGYPVYETIEHPDNTRAIVIADDYKSIIWEESSQYIKSIVTKEQFEIMSYEVE